MSLTDIYRALEAAAANGRLSGDDPPGLADLLRNMGVETLAVADGHASLGADSAWLTGTATYLDSSWSMLLTGRDAGARAALSIELTLGAQSAPWTLGQAFPDLPPSRRSAPFGSNGLVRGPSVVAPLVLLQPAINATNDPPPPGAPTPPRPRLSGSLPLDGDPHAPESNLLARYGIFLGTPLFVDGALDFTDPRRPVLELPAAAPSASLQLGRLEVTEVGIRLTTQYPDPYILPEQNAPLSAAMLYAKVRLPSNPPHVVEISGPLLFGDQIWPLQIMFDDPLDLEGGIQALLAIAGVDDSGAFSLPPGLAPLSEFGLSDVGFGIVPPSNGVLPSLNYTSLGIASRRPWDPPVPFLTIEEVGVRWLFTFGGGRPLIVGSIYGTMAFGKKRAASLGAQAPVAVRQARGELVGIEAGPDADKIVVTVRLDLPDFAFTAYTEEPFDLPIGKAFEAFFGSGAPDIGGLTVNDLSITASLTRKEFSAGLSVSGAWEIAPSDLVKLRLVDLQLQVFVSQSAVTGNIQGTAEITVPGKPPIELFASAEYPGDGSWNFEAALPDTLDLVRLVTGLIGSPPPPWVDGIHVELANLAFRFSTGPGKPYAGRGTLLVKVDESLLGFTMSLELTATIERKLRSSPADEHRAVALRGTAQVDSQTVTDGSLSGTFTITSFSVTASVAVTDASKTYTFVIAYRDLALSAATSHVGEGQARHQVLTLRLRGATLGEIVTYLVSLANPNATFRLDPPWDFLNTIDLSAFALVFDPTLLSVALTYDIKLDLGFADIQTVGVQYERSSGTSRVKLVLVAKMLGDTQAKRLSWDPVTQSPPSVAGKTSLFKLRYLGLGQHVTPKALTDATSITQVVDDLVKAMRPVNDTRKVPVSPADIDPRSQWLFGIDATVMDTVSIKMVLHDPDLYGIVIALSGTAAKSLAGLNLELLYKKVTDDIGVFHARLQIPDAFRHLQFGAVSVTLGIVTIDVFTNGNFRADLGFPHNRDFSVSFAVEAGIFNGRGGIYFGLLNGDTSTRVPRITNGAFSPVIELGVGLSVGVGRSFQQGPLAAGMYVNLIVIFEGALGWFNPDRGDAGTELYYWIRGSAGITGKVYGSVDFKIISIDVSIEITAMAALEMTAYQATLVELSLSVRVNASVKIIFFRINFSFSLDLRTSFVIGSDSTPPWRVASGQARRELRAAALVRAAALSSPTAAQDGYVLHFDKDAHVFPDRQPRTATLKLVPGYTVAGIAVDWSGQGAGDGAGDDHAGDGHAGDDTETGYRLVVMLVADNAEPPDAMTIADTHRTDVSRHPRATTAADTSFNQVAESLLRWSLDALGVDVRDPATQVTLAQLDELDAQLALDEAATEGFTWDNIKGFLGNNLHVLVSGTPAGQLAADLISGTPFPMLPVLEWTSDLPDPAQRDRKFWAYQPVDATYEAEALAYFEKLDPRPAQHRPSPAARLAAAVGEASESMATYVARDYFRLVARSATRAAINLLEAFPHTVEPTDSLQSIAGGFPATTVSCAPAPGDDVERIAEQLGLSAAELLALNPEVGTALRAPSPLAPSPLAPIEVAVGVTPQAIALANPDWPVAPGATVHLGAIGAQVQSTDTLRRIAERFGADLTSWVAGDALRYDAALLRAGATVPLPSFSYPNPTGLSVDEAAAVFYVRLGLVLPEDVPLADWYAEAIAALNPGNPPGPPPASLAVPRAYRNTQDPATWQLLPGDTADDVAAYLALVQNVVAGSAFDAWLQRVRAANASRAGAAVALPADAAATILGGDTLASLDTRLLSPASFAGLVVDADVLVPLVSVDMPGAVVTTGAGLTLLTLAQSYGLSLEDLAGRMAADRGVLTTSELAKRPLTVPDVPALRLDNLVAALHGGQPMATVSGEAARFMLAGLRLPAPVLDDGTYHARGPMAGVYELLGQQVTGPAPPPASEIAGDTPVVTLTVTKGQDAAWLTFAESVVIGPEHDEPTLGALRERNPALGQRSSPAGIIALGADADAAVLMVTEADLKKNYPQTSLKPGVVSPLAPLPLSHELGVRYPVSQVIPWQTTDQPELPGPPPAPSAGVGAPSLWPLSDELAAKAADGVSASRFLLEQAVPQGGPTAPVTELASYAWATLVRFSVRRIPGLPGMVEVLGADTTGRQRLADLIDYLGSPVKGESARLKLLWSLAPTPGMSPGLTSVPLASGGTFIVQTNLSTETRSGLVTNAGGADEPPTAGQHFASIADAGRFVALLWECSVVGGGGYWLQTRIAGGGSDGVPDAVFDQDGLAQLALLVQLASQSTIDTAEGWPVRNLRSFNSCAVVGDAVDPRTVSLSARPADPPELRAAPTVDPGQVGFEVVLANPGPGDDLATVTAQLYSLLGYQLLATAGFAGSGEGKPVSPQVPNGHDDSGVAKLSQDDETRWSLRRVVDISRYALRRLPELPTAPPPDGDPYAGIASAAGTQAVLWLQDVYGNTSVKPAEGPGLLPIPVRYTDPVLGASAWPSTTLSYAVEPSGALARVVVAVTLQAVAYQPAASDPGGVAAAKADRDRERFAAVYYQIMQPGVASSLRTSLQQRPGEDPVPLPVDIQTLRRYAIGSHALLGSIGAVTDARADAAAAGTLDAVVDQYGLDFDTLAAANADAVLAGLIGASTVAVPVSEIFRTGDTVAALCAGLKPPADPAPVLTDPDNVVLPLMAGVELSTPARAVTVRSATATAVDMATAGRCSLSTLVAANQNEPGLLTPGFIFEVNGKKVGVKPTPPASETTLALVAQTFVSEGVHLDAEQIVALNADVPGMFRLDASLAVDGYLVVAGDTLKDNAGRFTPAELATRNTATIDLFPPGTPLLLTTRPVAVPADDTLSHFATVNACSPGSLLRHNGRAPVGTSPPVVPGTWSWPADPTALRVPYTVRKGDSLAAIARRFLDLDPAGIVGINAAMPGVVAAGVTVTIGAESRTTTVPSSFSEVCALFSPPAEPADLATALAGRTDALAEGALLVCPPGVITDLTPGLTGVTPRHAAAPYGVSAVALLAANAATPDLLVAGQQLAAWPPPPPDSDAPPPPVETIAPHDTLTAIVERFRRRRVATGIGALVEVNSPVGFVRQGARVLVPPAAAGLATDIGTATAEGPAWSFPSPVFPVHVALEVARPSGQVDPALAATAERDRTTVPAFRSSGDRDGASLRDFAVQVQTAVPVLRLATGTGLPGQATDVWAVVFDAGAVAKVAVYPPIPAAGSGAFTPQPRSFALRPLATTLIARPQVPTTKFDVETGALSPGDRRNYQGIDLEVWARAALEDLELVLSPAYAAGAYALNRPALDAIAGAKKNLAGAVANGLDYVLAGQAPSGDGPAGASGDPRRAAAVETLRQQLLVSLVRGYDTAAVVQYDTSVESPWPATYARLSGNPVPTAARRLSGEPASAPTLTNGKVSLAAGASQVNIAVSVPDVAAHAQLSLDLDFSVVDLEFDITPGTEGYERSDWLTFLTPIGSGSPDALSLDLGSPIIPLPLRAYPSLPILVDHRAVVPTQADTLDEAARWRYQFSLQHQSAQQDSIGFEVIFNSRSGDAFGITDDDDLFTKLAQYVGVAKPLLGLLAGLASWETAPPDQRRVLATALDSFRVLIEAVATAWSAHWPPPTPPRPRQLPAAPDAGSGVVLDVYDFGVVLRTDPSATVYTGLELTRSTVTGPGGVGWPDIVCVTADGTRHPLTPHGGIDPSHRWYDFALGSKVAAFSLLTFELTFPHVHVASYQNASARTWVTRNAKLLGDTGPETAREFVYRTPDVSYRTPVVPFVAVTGIVPIDSWPRHPLPAMFDTIFDGSAADRTIAIGVRYAYTLVASDPPIEALLPVYQSPSGKYDGSTVGTVTSKVDQWLGDVEPTRTDAAWAFGIALYSSLDPGLQRPVLQLKRVSAALTTPADSRDRPLEE